MVTVPRSRPKRRGGSRLTATISATGFPRRVTTIGPWPRSTSSMTREHRALSSLVLTLFLGIRWPAEVGLVEMTMLISVRTIHCTSLNLPGPSACGAQEAGARQQSGTCEPDAIERRRVGAGGDRPWPIRWPPIVNAAGKPSASPSVRCSRPRRAIARRRRRACPSRSRGVSAARASRGLPREGDAPGDHPITCGVDARLDARGARASSGAGSLPRA